MKYLKRIKYAIYLILQILTKKRLVFNSLRKIRIINNKDTIRYIITNRISVSRFGDGEFALVSGSNTGFQSFNLEIQQKLKTILQSQNSLHITCIPHIWKKPYILKYEAFEYWSSWLLQNLDLKVMPYLKKDKIYYDSNFTRFYIDYRNDKNARLLIPIMKNIWNNQNICFIEGEKTRLGVGNDLFDNAHSISRILCPTKNAFYAYDKIIQQAKKQPKNTLFLIALGMTATCLAYDLSQMGHWAIDIGHIDIEYEWYLMKAEKKVAIPNKYVAEVSNPYMENKNEKQSVDEKIYQSQIIAIIK